MIRDFLEIYKPLKLPHKDILAEIYFVLDIEFNLTKQEILLGKVLSQNDFKYAKLIFEKRVQIQLPIQYIINKAFFMNDVFYVDENVLIPRDDTQILVEKAIDFINKYDIKSVLDIGTGSGIIAIELAKHTKVKITACDISDKALEIAQKNAKNLDVNINFIQSDLFSNINEKFDLIVSNPPYIPYSELATLQNEVKFEPHLALFAADDGLNFYTKITSEAQNYLNNQGYMIYEIGYNQGNAVKSIMEQNCFSDVFVEKDVSGMDRIVGGKLNYKSSGK